MSPSLTRTVQSILRSALILPHAVVPLLAQAEYLDLFDGQSLQGWNGDPRYWRVENGVIIGESTAELRPEDNTFLIWEGAEIEDFELQVDVLLRNHRSGIQYRSFLVEDQAWAVGGYQACISQHPDSAGMAYGERHKGILARRGEVTVVGENQTEPEIVARIGSSDEILAAIDRDGWNTYHIIASGNQVIQKINGVVVCEFSEKSNDRLRKGLIALQLHAGEPMKVSFRNIRLREIMPDEKKKVLFLAGKKSHRYGIHEHHAGCRLLARSLHERNLDVIAHVATDGSWPEPWAGYDRPDTVVMYCDGFDQHLAIEHQDTLRKLADDGVGVVCLHFATEVPPDALGRDFLDWIGGYFEVGWSVNPFWTPEFKNFPEHPISSGVSPFALRDEWYYHMRFPPQMNNVTPILSALPPLRSLTSRSKEPERGCNPTILAAVEAGIVQHTAWAYTRPNGGRGFGFTGGHFHRNWQNDNFRKVVLNALVWTAKGEIPAGGVTSRTPSEQDLELNQDFPKP